MTLLQHEIDYIAERLNDKIAERLDGTIRAILQKEMKRMTDQAVLDLTAATDAIVGELATVVTALQTEAKALAAALAGQPNLDPAIEAQAARLVAGTTAAQAAVAALQAPASPLPSPAPAPAAPAQTA